MKNARFFIALLALFLPSVCFAQRARYDNFAIKGTNPLQSIVGATITVCTSAGTGIPCTPTTNIYNVASGGSPIGNPFSADSVGNFGFWADPGTYIVTVSATGTPGYSYTVTLPCQPASTCTNSGTVTNTGTTNLAIHSGTIEADVQCATVGVLDQSCFTNSIALLNNSTLTAIHFKSGTWPITANITTTKQVTLYCDGEHSTIFQPTVAVTTVLTINNTGGGTGEQYGIYRCGFDMTSAPTATAVAFSNLSRPHVDSVDVRYPNAITSTGTAFSITSVAQIDFFRTFARNAGICILDNGDGGLEHHFSNITCESPLIAGVKVTRTAAPDVGALYFDQSRVTNPNSRVGAVGYWFTSSVGSTGTPFFLSNSVADSELGESVAVSADNATCASAGYCQTSSTVGTFLTAAQSPIYSVGQLVTIAGVTGGTCGTAPNGRYPIASVADSTHFTVAFNGTANQHCGAGTAALSADGMVIENMSGGTISITNSWFANLTAQANKNCAVRLKNVNNFKLANSFIQSAWGEICFEGTNANIQASNVDFESGAAGSNTWVMDDRLGVATTITGWRVNNNSYNDTNFAILASTAADATGTLVTGAGSNNASAGQQVYTRGDGGITQESVVKNTQIGATNPIKSWRVNTVGNLELLNNAHTLISSWGDAGVFNTLGSIAPLTAGAADVGQTAAPWGNLWLGTAGTNNFKFQPAATAAARVISIPDPLGATNMVLTPAAGTIRSSLHISDQGTACTNGELALSAGWQSTGSATVTAVAGTGQSCSWTITTGTTTAANPTVTDTLTNALPGATTVCWMNIYGGTHTAVAGESLRQTTLSATAPIFTANFTPTAGGTTYFVTRGCGP